MLISAVMPIMSIYRLHHGQYGYSGHVVNLPQDVTSSLPQLPSEVERRSHCDFCVRRDVVHSGVQWLVTHNLYYRVHFDVTALAQLPQDGIPTNLTSINVDSPTTDTSETESAAAAGEADCR